jgi:hypothetical protein
MHMPPQCPGACELATTATVHIEALERWQTAQNGSLRRLEQKSDLAAQKSDLARLEAKVEAAAQKEDLSRLADVQRTDAITLGGKIDGLRNWIMGVLATALLALVGVVINMLRH